MAITRTAEQTEILVKKYWKAWRGGYTQVKIKEY